MLKAPEVVLKTIEFGYVLPLKSVPTPLVQCNQQSALVHVNAEFVQQSLSQLLADRCVRRSVEMPSVVHYLWSRVVKERST